MLTEMEIPFRLALFHDNHGVGLPEQRPRRAQLAQLYQLDHHLRRKLLSD